jgi:predicted nuclease of predicted toxin-antitoxin system
MKLLIDMNLSPRLSQLLSDGDITSVHWSSVGAADATDSQIMAFARDEDYIVVTYDLDFSAILAATRCNKPSVIQIRARDLVPEQVCASILAAIRQMSNELQRGALLTIDLNKLRLRLLPLFI